MSTKTIVPHVHLHPSNNVAKSSSPDQHLPNELILMVLQHALGLHNPRPINYARFSSHIFPSGRLARFLTLSQNLYPMVLEAFYKHNLFVCKERADKYSWTLPPFGVYLPRPFVRHLLHRLDLTLEVACWYFDAEEMLSNNLKSKKGDKSSKSTADLARPIDNPEHLKRSPTWRTLINLTNATDGFLRLETLKLKISFEIAFDLKLKTYYDAHFWSVVKHAAITIKAPNVVMEGWRRKLEDVMTIDADDLQWIDTGSYM